MNNRLFVERLLFIAATSVYFILTYLLTYLLTAYRYRLACIDIAIFRQYRIDIESKSRK